MLGTTQSSRPETWMESLKAQDRDGKRTSRESFHLQWLFRERWRDTEDLVLQEYSRKERENTETTEHHPSLSNKAGFRLSYSNNAKLCRNKCDMKTKCRLRWPTKIIRVTEMVELDKPFWEQTTAVWKEQLLPCFWCRRWWAVRRTRGKEPFAHAKTMDLQFLRMLPHVSRLCRTMHHRKMFGPWWDHSPWASSVQSLKEQRCGFNRWIPMVVVVPGRLH